jgi:hypothetical protein
MPLLTIADSSYIGVPDVESATSCYIEKLGLQKVPAKMDDPEACVAAGFSKKDQTCIAVLGLGTDRLMERRRSYTPPTSGRRGRS